MPTLALHSTLAGAAPSWPPRLLIALVCLPFIVSGITKLLDPSAARAEMAHFGLPWPGLMAWAVIALQLAGSAAAVFGRGGVAVVALLALAAFTLAATLLAHAFWALEGAERALHTRLFVEHVSIVAGLLLAAWWHGQRALEA